MKLLDVNVLVYAHREDAPRHDEFKAYLIALLEGDESFGLSDLVLSGFMRVVTHPRVFDPPSSIADALQFASEVRGSARRVSIEPGPAHWSIFTRLMEKVGARGNLVPDAWFAALAIESGSEWVSTDRDFARFPGLRWERPLEP